MTKKAIFSAIISLISLNCSGTRPAFINNGTELAACPNTPNCVSTFSSDTTHGIKPIIYENDANSAMEKLVKIISMMERTSIINQTNNYLYVEFTSKLWRFVDDVEFLFDVDNKTINFRSASRLGKSDLGVNRKRMEEIREKFNKD